MLQLEWESQRSFSFAIIRQFRFLISCNSWPFLVFHHLLLYLLVLRRLWSLSLSLVYQLPKYRLFWFLSCDHTVWWNPIEFWNVHFQLHFQVHVHTKDLLCWILASLKTANVHTFLYNHASVCTHFGEFYHIHYVRSSVISCTTHPTKGWLASFVNQYFIWSS